MQLHHQQQQQLLLQQQQQHQQQQQLLQQPPRSQGGNIMFNNIISNSSNNIYAHQAMDCDPSPQSIISITPSSAIPSSAGATSVSLNVLNQRYMQHQHMHNRNNRLNPPLISSSGGSGGGLIQKQSNVNLLNNYAPASLPIDLLSGGGAGVSSGSGNMYNSIQLTHHQANVNPNKVSSNTSGSNSTRSGNNSNNNSNNNPNNNANPGDDSMVGVCVQQSPVVIH